MRQLAAKLWALTLSAGLVAGCSTERRGPVGSGTHPVTINVPADHTTIQAAINASAFGDTIAIAPGEYVENLSLTQGVALVGAGPSQTVLRGFIALDQSHSSIQNMRITAVGSSDPQTLAGIRGDAPSVVIKGNWIEDFNIGIRITGSEAGVVSGNIVRRNGVGLISLFAGPLTISNNLVLNNSKGGIHVNDGEEIDVVHNTVVGNGFGATPADGGSGIALLTFALERVQNNIVVSNNGGIDGKSSQMGVQNHNLVWGNASNYVGFATAASSNLSADPLFAGALQGDFHLTAASPAIDVGRAGLATADFDGITRPQGTAADLGAHEFAAPPATVNLIISEVMSNPIDEDRGEFVEIYNGGTNAVELSGMQLSDGDARDTITAYQGKPTLVPAGAYAVIVDPEYTTGYGIPDDATIVTVGNSTLGNGLTTTDPITLYASDGVTVVASFRNPFNPGNGVSAERVDLNGPDAATNWRASPCLQSAGRPNCATATLASGLVISEVMSNPLDETSGEFIEIYNGSDSPMDTAGMTISDSLSADTIQGFKGGTTIIPARGYGVILDPDWPDDQLFRIDPNAVLLTVGDTALGNGLGASEPLVLADGSGMVLDTYSHPIAASNGKSVEKVSLSQGDVPSNWAQSSCSEGSSPGRLNCVSEVTAGPRKPLVITEVMANPLDEDTGEFVEIYNRGIDPVDAAGLLLSDGDATDVLQAFGGGSTVIPAGGYAVIVDAEYAGNYTIPAGTILLTTTDTTLGSGLSIDDPIRLLEANGVEIIDTFRFPFNPGNGISAEKIDVRAFDSPANWTASTCASGSSPGATNCAALPAGLPKRLRITEVMANMAGTEANGEGEFVELFNAGERSVDLAGMVLEIGPVGGSTSRDQLTAHASGSTVLSPGAYAVVVDRDYDGRYAFPAGTIVVTITDSNFGSSSLATTHAITLYDLDGVTALDKFRFPSDPGDGISLSRVSLSVTDSESNWIATPCGSTPGSASCPTGGQVTSFTSFWLDSNASESGIYWYQAIGWPARGASPCEESIVCTGGDYGYDFRDNFPAASSFGFTNPYSQYSITFVERSSPTGTCSDPCPNASTIVGPGQTVTVPASSMGYYFAITSGPSLNTLDWYGGDPNRYWALPPDGTLAPFTVDTTRPPPTGPSTQTITELGQLDPVLAAAIQGPLLAVAEQYKDADAPYPVVFGSVDIHRINGELDFYHVNYLQQIDAGGTQLYISIELDLDYEVVDVNSDIL